MIATSQLNLLERATRVMFTKILVALSQQLRDSDLTVEQLTALHLVDQTGTIRSSALGETLGLSPSAVSRMVDGLVGRGLVTREEDAEDRRARRLGLSDEGRELLRVAGTARVRVIAATIEANAPAPVIRGVLKAMEAFLSR